MKLVIAESARFSEKAMGLLTQWAEVTALDADREALLKSLGEADILWVRLRHRIDREVMEAAPRLKTIVSPTTGLNHIDLDEARRRNINVVSLKGETAFLDTVRATAEHTVGLALSLLRSVPAAVEHVRAGGWNRDLFRGREIAGKQVGIVGYGRLGRMVADLFHAFGARLLATDTNPSIEPSASHVQLVDLDRLLGKSDIVSLHASFSEANRSFFGAEAFAAMKEGSWLINTARGELVDEAALLDALQSGRLAGAALDVLAEETATVAEGHALVNYAREHGRLVITPHIGGCTFESMADTECFLAEKLSAGPSAA